MAAVWLFGATFLKRQILEVCVTKIYLRKSGCEEMLGREGEKSPFEAVRILFAVKNTRVFVIYCVFVIYIYHTVIWYLHGAGPKE